MTLPWQRSCAVHQPWKTARCRPLWCLQWCLFTLCFHRLKLCYEGLRGKKRKLLPALVLYFAWEVVSETNERGMTFSDCGGQCLMLPPQLPHRSRKRKSSFSFWRRQILHLPHGCLWCWAVMIDSLSLWFFFLFISYFFPLDWVPLFRSHSSLRGLVQPSSISNTVPLPLPHICARFGSGLHRITWCSHLPHWQDTSWYIILMF